MFHPNTNFRSHAKNEKQKKVSEAAVGSNLQDLASSSGDPQDIQKKIQQQADDNEKNIATSKQQQQPQQQPEGETEK